jgi:menaquinone-specific isochorismate synthase
VVIDAIRAALADCCDGFDVPRAPRVMQLTNAQHLWSPITARPRPGVGLFELAERLHPTPATNGQPRAAAQDWLRRTEPFERGWYTGAAGLVRPDGTGELWVLLRCARVSDAQAELFAGAGIVAGSDPASEWDETEAKLAAMLSALQYA